MQRRPTARVEQGDCREVLAREAANSHDACVCDPPYDLTQSSRKGSPRTTGRGPAGRHRIGEGGSGGFMGKTWDATGVAFDPATWRKVFRVLKPGAHLVAFGGTRTHHRLICAIEDAGFEVRDALMWIYGQGFPKSHDVSKAIDKANGVKRKVVGQKMGVTPKPSDGAAPFRDDNWMPEGKIIPQTAPATPEAAAWQGWGTALKPAWEPIILARKPLSEGSVAANVLRWGTGAINVGACKVGTEQIEAHGGGQNDKRIYDQGKGIPAIKRGANPHVGRWPANLVLSHDPRCVLVGTEADPGYAINRFKDGAKPFGGGAGHEYDRERVPGGEREVWACVPGCPARMLDEQSGLAGHQGKPYVQPRKVNGGKIFDFGRHVPIHPGGIGGASRFFKTVSGRDGEPSAERTYADEGATNIAAKPGVRRVPTTASRFFYTAKASSAERVLGCPPGFANRHPTVKPLALMRWLVRLVAPPGGVVLDPFAGSGSTLVAAMLEGHDSVGIDQDSESVACARGRLAAAERYGASLTRLKRVRVKRRRFKRAKNT